MLAATPDDAYNALVCTRFAPELGRERVHQLATSGTGTRHEASREWRGKVVIDETMTFQRLADLMQAGASLVVEPVEDVGSPGARVEDGWPIAVIRESGELAFVGVEHDTAPARGDLVVRLYQAALAPTSAIETPSWRRWIRRQKPRPNSGDRGFGGMTMAVELKMT